MIWPEDWACVVLEMGRPHFEGRISIQLGDRPTLRLNLVEIPDGTWQVWRDGRRSEKLPYATSTEIGRAIGHMLAAHRGAARGRS